MIKSLSLYKNGRFIKSYNTCCSYEDCKPLNFTCYNFNNNCIPKGTFKGNTVLNCPIPPTPGPVPLVQIKSLQINNNELIINYTSS